MKNARKHHKKKKRDLGFSHDSELDTELHPQINGQGFLILTGRLDNLKDTLEIKFEQVFNNQAVLTDRVNKRESEIEELEKENKNLRERTTQLESAQTTMRWILPLAIAGAGVLATVVSLILK